MTPVSTLFRCPFQDVPLVTPPQAPFVLSYGGTAVMVDEGAPNNIYWVDTSLVFSTGAWATSATTGAPANRIAERFLDWGSTLYLFGGFDTVAQTQNNDLYAVDIASALNPNIATQPWIQVSDPTALPGAVANYPDPRVGYTWTSFSIGAIMMGGLSVVNPDGTPAVGVNPFDCLNTTAPPAGCFWHSHVWAFLPGAGNPKIAGGMVGQTAWVRFNQAGANGGPTPDGRVEHCAGNMGDQVRVSLCEGGKAQAIGGAALFAHLYGGGPFNETQGMGAFFFLVRPVPGA